MDDLWRVLVQFVFRLTYGVALAMLLTPCRLVNSGFFRVHMWVLMGFNTFASLAVASQRAKMNAVGLPANWLLGAAIAMAVLCYLGAALWLYESKKLGTTTLLAVGISALAASFWTILWKATSPAAKALWAADVVSSGLLMGATLTAMLLGHWYLNSPGMQLKPLKRLVFLIGCALLLRACVNGAGLYLEVMASAADTTFYIFVSFRWLAGIVGTLVMAIMAWYTLKIPNTQSATGILYAGVIVCFLGELTSQLMSASTRYPL